MYPLTNSKRIKILPECPECIEKLANELSSAEKNLCRFGRIFSKSCNMREEVKVKRMGQFYDSQCSTILAWHSITFGVETNV